MRNVKDETVELVIQLAQQLAKARQRPEWSWRALKPGEIADRPEEEVKLVTLIESLPEQEKLELKALMWIGRGDYRNWDQAMRHAGKEHAGIGTYMASREHLVGDLEDGWNWLKREEGQGRS